MAIQGVRTASLAAFAAVLALALPAAAREGPASDLPEAQAPMATGSRAMRPIAAWTAFCLKDPGSCSVRGDEPERIVLDQATWSLIVEINDAVNDAIVPLKDIDHWGVEDVWGFPDDGVGDCEDYQLLKRRRLEEAGLPRRAMRMTVVIDDVGEGHAVLSILTDRGDLVLDNKRGHANALPPVLHAFDTGYRYIKREGSVPGPDGGPWVALGPDPSPAAVAVAAAGAPAP